MKFESKCLHAGYDPENGGARALPIYQSTTFKFNSTDYVAKLFDLEESAHFYTRLSNPTTDCVEKKIAELEGGVGALCTASGQAANTLAILNILQAGDHLVSTQTIYGGTVNLFGVTMKKMGIECTFVDAEASPEEIQKAFRPNTKAVFGETIANPAIAVLDIEKFAKIAHANGVPFIIDNTFATPYLCRPIEFGADIVIHSTTKYMDGHAIQMGGVIVDSGNFDWTQNDKFPGLTQPDDSYHGMVYTRDVGRAAYITKARVQLMRDLGVVQTPMGAFLLNLGLETLPVRMDRHCRNAEIVAEYLAKHPMIDDVCYPTLKGNIYEERAKKYLPKGSSGVISMNIKGGRDAAAKFIDSLKMASLVIHVADIRTCVLHPASTTHRQLTDEQLIGCGITPGLVRLSVGLENVDDIIEDLEQALQAIK